MLLWLMSFFSLMHFRRYLNCRSMTLVWRLCTSSRISLKCHWLTLKGNERRMKAELKIWFFFSEPKATWLRLRLIWISSSAFSDPSLGSTTWGKKVKWLQMIFWRILKKSKILDCRDILVRYLTKLHFQVQCHNASGRDEENIQDGMRLSMHARPQIISLHCNCVSKK